MPTALELGPEGWKLYLPRAPATGRSPSVSSEEREQLVAMLQAAARVLKESFGADRVFLFGSLGRGEGFERRSDVDVAVEGLKGDYWQAWGVLEEAIPERVVELVELEAASPSLRSSIEREGIEL